MKVMRYPRPSVFLLYASSFVMLAFLALFVLIGFVPKGDFLCIVFFEVIICLVLVIQYFRSKPAFAKCPICCKKVMLKDGFLCYCRPCDLILTAKEGIPDRKGYYLAVDVFRIAWGFVLGFITKLAPPNDSIVSLRVLREIDCTTRKTLSVKYNIPSISQTTDEIEVFSYNINWELVELYLYRKLTVVNFFLGLLGVPLSVILTIGWPILLNYSLSYFRIIIPYTYNFNEVLFLFVFATFPMGLALSIQYYRWLTNHPKNYYIKLSPDGEIVEKG